MPRTFNFNHDAYRCRLCAYQADYIKMNIIHAETLNVWRFKCVCIFWKIINIDVYAVCIIVKS